MSAEARAEITRLASSAKAAHRLVVRAGIILHASEGKADAEVAGLMRVSARTAGEWRRRFAADPRVDALEDAKRSGRPPRVALATRLEVVKLACNRPDGDKAPFRDVWTQQSLADALVAYMHGVAACYPDREVHVVWDNLNIHYDGKDARWTEFNRANGDRFRFVYTPLHASWVNQVEVWFSILERRVLRHGSFSGVPHLAETVLAFIRHWNAVEAHPFRWTFRGRVEQTRLVRAA